VAGYYAHITALDQQVGRILTELDQQGLTENTLVVFTSDHGDMLWSHMLKNKQLPYEESIHIPLIMRLPGQLNPGQRSDLLISVVDFAPTLLGLLNVPVPESMEGMNLSAHIQGNDSKQPQSVFINNYAAFDQARGYQPWRGVRTSQYTYARWRHGTAVLFDLQNDPYQMKNLANNPQYQQIQTQLEQELADWLVKTDDGFLPAEEHIANANQSEEWFLREEHFRGGFNY
jgi:arylsulfatase A-like enzyme